MGIQAARDQIVTQITNITGSEIRQVYDDPPSQLANGLSAVIFPVHGRSRKESHGWRTALHDVTVGILTPDKDKARDFALVEPYIDLVPNKLEQAFEDNLFTALDNFGDIEWVVGPVNWGGQKYFGILFTIHDVKIQPTVT